MADEMAKRQEKMPARRGQAVSPYRSMRDVMSSMMEDFFSEWPLMRIRPFEWRMQEFSPSIDIIDEEKDIRVQAEVPGMNPEDLDITVTRDSVIVKGEKKSEREEERQGLRYSERTFGSFERVIRLPADVQTDKIDARFKNGVLDIVMPKSEQALKESKKIQIRSEGQQQVGRKGRAGRKPK
jgi:HSP20 family protein